MRKTYCEAKMKFVDVTAKEDSKPESDDKTYFSQIELLKDEKYEKDIGMLNNNGFILDGSMDVLDVNEKVAFWSEELSDDNGIFTNPPTINISFGQNHASAGITLVFANDYPQEINVKWYSLSGEELANVDFNPDNKIYFCKQQVINYGGISVKFLKTRFPNQFVRVSEIDYGMNVIWKDSDIKKAKVLEEVNTISTTLSINTASIDIVDSNNDFDIANEDGAWKDVQKTQEVTLTEYIDDKPVPMGTFYISEKSFSKNIASFSLIDAIGLMDNYTYYRGTIYDREKAGLILEDIFRASKIEKYDIDEAVYNIELSGWLPVQKCREALQMICFACGATADDSRSDTIKVYIASGSSTNTIEPNRKFFGKTKTKLDVYVNGVSIECNKYTLDEEKTEIYNNYLEKGLNTITFGEPYKADSIEVSGCTIYEVKTNYVTVDVMAAGICVISGKKYSTSAFRYQIGTDADAGEADNMIQIGPCTIYDAARIQSIASHILDYYKLRKIVEMDYILENEYSGNWVTIADNNSNLSTTLIESQNIDLTGGFISSAACRGYVTVVTDVYYTGNQEIYTGNNGII